MKKQKNKRPSDPLFRFKSCFGKKKYKSQSEAMSMLRKQKRYGEQVDGIRPYMCEFCNQWHLGHEMTDEE